MFRVVFPGDPIAQQRFRSFQRGNRMCLFDAQGLYKRNLRMNVRDMVDVHNSQEEKWQMPHYPKIRFWFFMPIPKSMNKKDRELAEAEMLKHVKKPDVDNLIKLYLDVITEGIILDDNSVQIGKAIKIYSPNPRTVMLVEETSQLITNDDLYNAA